VPYNSKRLSDLQAERTNDPHGRSYSGMNDAQFHTSVNLEDISVPRETNGVEVFNAYVGSELPSRSSDAWQNLILLGSMSAGNTFKLEGNILVVLKSAFGPGTQTRTNLIALTTEDKSPAFIAGLPIASLGDVGKTNG